MADYHCPACGVPLTVQEHLGGSCPACDEPLAAATRSDFVPEDEPEVPHYQDYAPPVNISSGWESVRSGLHLLLIANILMVVVIVLMVVVVIAVAAADPLRGPGVAAGLMCPASLLAVAAFLMALVGYARCCSAPPEDGVRGLAIGTLVCFLAAIGLSVLGSITGVGRPGHNPADPFGAAGGGGGTVLSLVSSALQLLAGVLFLLFLRGVALAFRKPKLAASCMNFLIVAVAGLFITILAAVFLSVAMAGNPNAANTSLLLVVGGALLLGFLFMFCWYLSLLKRTRDAIAAAPPRRLQPVDDYELD